MANRRIYNEYIPYDRPKLPRSKYGNIVNTAVGTTTYYSNPGTNVGASMASVTSGEVQGQRMVKEDLCLLHLLVKTHTSYEVLVVGKEYLLMNG